MIKSCVLSANVYLINKINDFIDTILCDSFTTWVSAKEFPTYYRHMPIFLKLEHKVCSFKAFSNQTGIYILFDVVCGDACNPSDYKNKFV